VKLTVDVSVEGTPLDGSSSSKGQSGSSKPSFSLWDDDATAQVQAIVKQLEDDALKVSQKFTRMKGEEANIYTQSRCILYRNVELRMIKKYKCLYHLISHPLCFKINTYIR
jgi:Txe/YoeB family toxin of Txe-Axe toxin-antitoxin module